MRADAERQSGVLGRMTDVNKAGTATDAWLSSQLAHDAAKPMSEGRLFVDPDELDGVRRRNSWNLVDLVT